jgi:hypothetical protein
MDLLVKRELEESVAQKTQFILENGDEDYLFNLSFPNLIEALEGELLFLGLYPYGDHETAQAIHEILVENLPNWFYMAKRQRV